MNIHHTSDVTNSNQLALMRYEASRKELVALLEQKMTVDSTVALPGTVARTDVRAVLDRGISLIVPLTRFIQREIQILVDLEEIEENTIEADDVLMATLAQAWMELPADIGPQGLYPWLRKVSQQEIRESAQIESERTRTERSLESPVRIAGEDWPDRVLLLRQVLADPNALMPDYVIDQQETWALLQRALQQIPERWREIFLMRSVDGRDDDEIATAEGIDVNEVELINVASRTFLGECLRDSGLLAGD